MGRFTKIICQFYAPQTPDDLSKMSYKKNNSFQQNLARFARKCLLLFAITSITIHGVTQVISLHPKNPHYFFYKGKPAILITSAEHYGAVINSDFDYKTYLDVLKKNGFNLTRIFVGSYCEGSFYDFAPGKELSWQENQNTLAVRPEKLIVPWARSNTAGYLGGGNKFDLDKWDEHYLTRLKDFCKQAAQRNIIVEIVFFSANYGPVTWKNSPLNIANNINNIGDVAYNETHLLKNKDLIDRQLSMVRKIVEEMNGFDNIYFEICNEPYWIKGIPEVEPSIKAQQFLPETDEWQKIISSAIKTTEQHLPKKHLIAQNFANKYFKIEKPDSAVAIFNFHYAYPPSAVTDNYWWNKPIAFDETFEGLNAPGRRREAWAFILAGGAVYDNLDWSFATDDATGRGRNIAGLRQSGREVWEQLGILSRAINSFDFINAKPLDSSYVQNLPDGINFYGLGIKGKDYLLYLVKNKATKVNECNLPLPAGKYLLKWIDPVDGSILKQERTTHSDNSFKIKCPSFTDDIALRIKALK